MRIPARLLSIICALLLLVPFGHHVIAGGQGRRIAVKAERPGLRNQYGAAIQDADGKSINYSQVQLDAQRSTAQANEPPATPATNEATTGVGDWNGDGTVTIGVYDPPSRTFYLRNNNSAGFADLTVQYGPAGATPLGGNWNGL